MIGGKFLHDHELGRSNLDLVMTRRDTGASYLIDRVKTNLATKSVADVLAEWRWGRRSGAPGTDRSAGDV